LENLRNLYPNNILPLVMGTVWELWAKGEMLFVCAMCNAMSILVIFLGSPNK